VSHDEVSVLCSKTVAVRYVVSVLQKDLESFLLFSVPAWSRLIQN